MEGRGQNQGLITGGDGSKEDFLFPADGQRDVMVGAGKTRKPEMR